ncbi:MAG: hypothetical protein PHI47_09540 [Sulfuricurvum sp.]|uniref:hypothetical protein n=1 Tax=Sulfuricurvum sp. TaxID=2025608 RepID=UPI00261CED59|nr:hypothetical protein [Sulfuricurvum sp.]MDD5158653.1 hypothetical protein [Sulfuricurvum sp.]MDD5160281.1 hypothetical protein [Sulfuricurvum sp.]
MILTLRSLSGTVHIDITADQFKRLRDPSIHADELDEIAAACGCDAVLLFAYAEDLKRAIQETMEIDGSCDYSDHL